MGTFKTSGTRIKCL